MQCTTLVRYWRVIAVDYASKTRTQGEHKRAIRNIKLRMSRKLLYAAGLLKCFRCALETNADGFLHEVVFPELFQGHDDLVRPYVETLRSFADITPADMLAGWMIAQNTDSAIVRDIFNSYDEFLKCLDSPQNRAKLESKIGFDPALFDHLRDVSHEFQRGLTSLFFDSHSELAQLTRNYAVF